jgi:hypothetical protein
MNIHILLGLHKDAQTEVFQAPSEFSRWYLPRNLSILAVTQQMLRLFHEHNEDYENIFRIWLWREE